MALTRPVDENGAIWTRMLPPGIHRHQVSIQVRVWFNYEPGDPDLISEAYRLEEVCNHLAHAEWSIDFLQRYDFRLMARQVAGMLERVNAVEVKSGTLFVVYYPEWP